MNLIISVLDPSELYEKYTFDFVHSLRKYYSGDILILLYDEISNDLSSFLSLNNVKVISQELTSNYVNNQRIYDIAKLLPQLNYDSVFIFDIDIWFQNNINSLISLTSIDKFIYTSDISIKYNFSNLAYNNIFKEDYDRIKCIGSFNKIIDDYNTIINCGVLGGSYRAVKDKLNNYLKFVDKTNDSYGLDTCIFNNIFDKQKDIILDSTYNYLAKQKLIIEDGLYYNSNKEKINILHVAGQSGDKLESYYPDSIRKLNDSY